MTVWVLIERIEQNEYTEPHYYIAADPTGEVIGVFDEYGKANEEKERLEAKNEKYRFCEYFYDIEEHTLR